MSTVVDFMSQPSTHFEPSDPTPLRTCVVDNEEFNYLAMHHRKDIEYGDTTASFVVDQVEYVTHLMEATA